LQSDIPSLQSMATQYQNDIRNRSRWHYLKGLLIRWWTNLKYARARRIARRRGATIGEAVVMPLSLARKANANLVVGNHVSIQTDRLDLRNPIHIGNHVIIGHETEIITTSHYIDSPGFEHKYYGVNIEDYAWIAPRVILLPSCRSIGYGAVVGCGSVVASNVNSMSVVSGNPALEIKLRTQVHTDLVVESLLGGDFEAYRKARKSKS